MAKINMLEATRRVATILAPLSLDQKQLLLRFVTNCVDAETAEAATPAIVLDAGGDEDSVSAPKARASRPNAATHNVSHA